MQRLRSLAQRSVIAVVLSIFSATIIPARADPHAPYRVARASYAFTENPSAVIPAIPMAAIVQYPAAMKNGSAVPGTDMFPAVVFMQGGNVDAWRYSWLGALAEYGYIVVLPDRYEVTAANLNGQPGMNPNTKLTTVNILDAAVRGLHAWAATAASPINGHFDGQVVLSGHSLGGVIAIAAVLADCMSVAGAIAQCPPAYSLHTSVRGMFLIGGHYENPNGPPDSSPLIKPPNFPIYMIAGEHDGASTTAEVQTSFRRFNAPKIYYEQPGANHFGWTDYLHPADDLRTDQPATLLPKVQQAATIQAVRLFLDCNFKNISAACSMIPATPVAP